MHEHVAALLRGFGSNAFNIVMLGLGLMGLLAGRGQRAGTIRLESVALVGVYVSAVMVLAR